MKILLISFQTILFQGRNLIETLKMIDVLDAWNGKKENLSIPFSVELENGSEKAKDLIPRGDVVFVAKEFARFLGYDNPLSTIQGLATQVKPGQVYLYFCTISLDNLLIFPTQ